MALSHAESLKQNLPEHMAYPELGGFIELTRQLHDVVNDPDTRAENAPIKAKLIHELALERLKSRGIKDPKVETIEALQKETDTLTHNVVVTLGDPGNGPTTLFMVHHDVISAQKDSSGHIPLEDNKNEGELSGRTIQDNTIHLAATIESLGKIVIPEKGAVIVVFTDHEENGCRGSHALKKQLADRLNSDQPVALIALESTQDSNRLPVKVGVGHRGKFDAEVEGGLSGTAVDTFLGFYERLSEAAVNAYEASADVFGRTAGTSTYGSVDSANKDKALQAKLDFRTNKETTPSDVLGYLTDPTIDASTNPRNWAFGRVAELLRKGVLTVKIEGDRVLLGSNSELKHPAFFNPLEDETVMPLLYSLISKLKNKDMAHRVRRIEWGNVKNQNSNPTEAFIQFEGEFAQSDLINLLNELESADESVNDGTRSVSMPIKENSVMMTGAVLGESDDRRKKVLEAVGGESSYLTFMTDIGAQFGELTERQFSQLYTYIFGVGDPKKLHKDEKVSYGDIRWLISRLPVFVNAVSESLNSPNSG